MKLHHNILPNEQREIYESLSSLKDEGFILFGGTAIALQLGHRESIDFDFFSKNDINHLKDYLLKLPNIKAEDVLQNTDNTLTFITDKNVKISFFGNLPFATADHSFLPNDSILQIANLDILLATKLKVINDRAEYKDYKDIAEILKSKEITLSTGMSLFEKYYSNTIPKYQILKGLQFFEDGDLYKLSKEDKEILKSEVFTYSKKISISKAKQQINDIER